MRKKSLVIRNDDLERLELPATYGDFMDERLGPHVRRVAVMAQWGLLDLKQLARDAYFQGIYDTLSHLEEAKDA